MAEFEEDCETMFRNAMQYNEVGSQIYRDAQNLLVSYIKTTTNLLSIALIEEIQRCHVSKS